MSGHAAYIAGAFGMTFVAIAVELLWLAKRRRRHHLRTDDDEDGTP